MDKAAHQRLVCRINPGREQHFGCHCGADAVDQAGCAADTVGHPQSRGRNAKSRVCGCNPEVASHCQCDAAAETDPPDGRDHRF